MNRTPDLLITNELLYRLSYTGLSLEALNKSPAARYQSDLGGLLR